MDGSCYFEIDPWVKACENIAATEGAANVAEVNVQCICLPEGGAEAKAKWEKRLEELLGKAVSADTVSFGRALSELLKYENGAIVRLFIDEGNRDSCENFEIVTKEALYIWRPASHPQGYIETEAAGECICTQLYSKGLEAL